MDVDFDDVRADLLKRGDGRMVAAYDRLTEMIEAVEVLRQKCRSLDDLKDLLEKTDPVLRGIRDFVSATKAKEKACIGKKFYRPFETAMYARTQLLESQETVYEEPEVYEAMRRDIVDDATDVIQMTTGTRRAAAYGTRAKAKGLSRRRDGVLADYREALKNIDAKDLEFRNLLRRQIVEELAKDKADCKTRPHYDRDERHRLAKELRMFAYAPSNYRCLTCGASKKALSRCSRCQLVWFCSRECQAAGWSAHKRACYDVDDEKVPPIEITLSRNQVPAYHDFLDRQTTCFHHTLPDGTILSLFLDNGDDPKRIFDSLSNRSVTVFTPKVAPAAPMDVDDNDSVISSESDDV